LTVESSLLCSLLQGSDDYGLFDTSEFVEEAKISSGGSKDRARKPVTASPSLSKEKDSRSSSSQDRDRPLSSRMKERKATPPPNDMEIIVMDADDDGGA
jgi:hypothetical protein